MNCNSCGTPVPPNASFCPECGAFVAQPAPEPEVAPEPAPVSEPVPELVLEPEPVLAVAEPAPQQPFGGQAAPQPEPAYQQPFGGQAQQPFAASVPPGQSVPPASGNVVYEKGCIAAAWKDIKESPGWLMRMALLGIIQCVPILNFFAAGYALNWAREVPFGGKTPMPKKIFSGSNFEIGFYAFVITLVCSVVGGLAASILAFVPIVGALAGSLLSLGILAFGYLCCVRMAIKQSFAEGFKLSIVWDSMMKSPGTFLAAAILPAIISLIAGFVLIAVGGILGVGSMIPLAFISGEAAVLVFGAVFLLGTLVLYVAFCMIMMLATLLSDRALAHWVGRQAPEWIL